MSRSLSIKKFHSPQPLGCEIKLEKQWPFLGCPNNTCLVRYFELIKMDVGHLPYLCQLCGKPSYISVCVLCTTISSSWMLLLTTFKCHFHSYRPNLSQTRCLHRYLHLNEIHNLSYRLQFYPQDFNDFMLELHPQLTP